MSPLPREEATPPVTKTCLVGCDSGQVNSRGRSRWWVNRGGRIADRSIDRPRGSSLPTPGPARKPRRRRRSVASVRCVTPCAPGIAPSAASTAPYWPVLPAAWPASASTSTTWPAVRPSASTVETSCAAATSSRTALTWPPSRPTAAGPASTTPSVSASTAWTSVVDDAWPRPAAGRRCPGRRRSRTAPGRRAGSSLPSADIRLAVLEAGQDAGRRCRRPAAPPLRVGADRRGRAARRSARSGLASGGDGHARCARPSSWLPSSSTSCLLAGVDQLVADPHGAADRAAGDADQVASAPATSDWPRGRAAPPG